jgi:hypothetical protein
MLPPEWCLHAAGVCGTKHCLGAPTAIVKDRVNSSKLSKLWPSSARAATSCMRLWSSQLCHKAAAALQQAAILCTQQQQLYGMAATVLQ